LLVNRLGHLFGNFTVAGDRGGHTATTDAGVASQYISKVIPAFFAPCRIFLMPADRFTSVV
jgi:hypothetical protein